MAATEMSSSIIPTFKKNVLGWGQSTLPLPFPTGLLCFYAALPSMHKQQMPLRSYLFVCAHTCANTQKCSLFGFKANQPETIK